MAPQNLTQLRDACEPAAGSTRPPLSEFLLIQYLCSAALEFSFTGFSSYFALVKRTLAVADRAGHFDEWPDDERAAFLAEPPGLLIRGISSLIKKAPHFPSAWRFVHRDWSFSENFTSVVAEDLNPKNPGSGPWLQMRFAKANGIPLSGNETKVPVEYRRER